MARGSLSFKGTADLSKKLKRNASLDDVKKVVKLNTSEMQRNMQRKAVFRGHWRGKKFIRPTGTTKRSITQSITDGGFTGKAGPGTEYSPYLIYGTRFMSPQDFFRPAYFEQRRKFINDMKRLMR